MERAFPSGALPVTVTRNLPALRSFFGSVSVTVTLRRVAPAACRPVTSFLPLRESTTCAVPMPSARKRIGTRHFFFLSAWSFFFSFCTPSVTCGASVQAWSADGGAMKRGGADRGRSASRRWSAYPETVKATADAGRDLRQRDARGLRRHDQLGRRAGEALEHAVALGIGRVRRERERARLRDREAGGRGLLHAAGRRRRWDRRCRRVRVDELQQDQRRELRPDAHAATVAADAARAVLHAGSAAVAATAEHAGGRRDRLHDDLDRSRRCRRARRRAGRAVAPAPPSERRRPPSVSGPCAATRTIAPALPPCARVAVGAGGARGVDGAADEQRALGGERRRCRPARSDSRPAS